MLSAERCGGEKGYEGQKGIKMAELKPWKRIKCFLSGGHRYADINMLMLKDPYKPQYIFTNNCVKCGKAITVRVSKKALDSILEADLRRRRAEDGNS